MGESKELKSYKEQELLKLREFNAKVEAFMEILDEYKVPKDKRKKLIEEFNKKFHPERDHLVKSHNFIMDIRKPSFAVFIFFTIFAIYGFIAFLTFIICEIKSN